jgi:hypothetical protein
MHLRVLGKEEQTKQSPGVVKKRNLSWNHWNWSQKNNTKFNEIKNWFFESFNEIDKILSKLPKETERKCEPIELERKGGILQQALLKKKMKICRDYLENFCSNKLDNVEEIDKFLGT